MKIVQSQAGIPSRFWRLDWTRAGRDDDELLGVRQRNDRAVPSHTGATGVLPRMFSIAEVRGRWRRLAHPALGPKATLSRGLFFT